MYKKRKEEKNMKKKILLVALIAAMAISSTSACAEVGGEITKSAPDMAVQTLPQGTPAYARHDAVIKEVADGSISLDIGEEQPETATISEDTIIMNAKGDKTDASALKAGVNVSVFVDGNAPVTLIYPAQYPASYIVIGDEENVAGVDIDVYTESDSLGMYINGANTLAINTDENSNIATVSGTKIKIDHTDLANKELAVFYSTMTMSIPAQTYPERIVVLKDAPEAAVPEIKLPEASVGKYIKHDVIAVKSENDIINVKNENGEEYTINASNAVLLDDSGNNITSEDITEGKVITAFVNANSPAPAIEPPVYYADVVIVNNPEGNIVDVDTYTKSDSLGMYINGANTLAINVDENTEIVPSNGTRIRIDHTDLAGRDLVVFYDITTMSLPPQASPKKVVVLMNDEEAPAEITSVVVGDKTVENIYKEGDTLMVPVRAIAEGLSYTVGWNGDTKAVTISGKAKGMNSVEFKIGSETAVADGDMVYNFETAPVLKDDLTYVPVSLFTDILSVSSANDNGNLVLNIAE